jgi:hypothetical protein
MLAKKVKREPLDPIGGPILYELLANMIDGPDRYTGTHGREEQESS